MKCKHCGGTGVEPDWRVDGEDMRRRRKKYCITLRELARRLGVAPAYISDMENGRRQYLPKWRDRANAAMRNGILARSGPRGKPR